MTANVREPIASRGLPREEQTAERRAALHKALYRVGRVRTISRLKVATEIKKVMDELLAVRPAWVKSAEWQIASGGDPDAIERMPLSKDDLAMLTTGKSDAEHAELTELQNRSARRIQARWKGHRWAFRQGRPPYRYTALAHCYIDYIEALIGSPFRFSRPFPWNGKPSGPEMRPLVAALDLALFASGPPKLEILASIVRERRRQSVNRA
jgi:hypothetical protein